MGRREAHISRFIEGSSSGFQRPAFIDPLGRERVLNHRARPARLRNPTRNSLFDAPQLNLQCALPINLREFLAEQFAGGLRIDEDGVFALGPDGSEDALSRVARAIRRYSTERTRERWEECATMLARLGDDLDWAAESGEAVVLCLGCAVVETGVDAVGHHRGVGCIAVELSAEMASHIEEPRDLSELLLRVVEGFRLGRAALGLSHYDLDCYVARKQVIFTWRPLSS